MAASYGGVVHYRKAGPLHDCLGLSSIILRDMGLGLSRVSSILFCLGGSCRLRNRTDAIGVRVEVNIPFAE